MQYASYLWTDRQTKSQALYQRFLKHKKHKINKIPKKFMLKVIRKNQLQYVVSMRDICLTDRQTKRQAFHKIK